MYMGGLYRGLSVEAMDEMDPGEIVDFCITYNNLNLAPKDVVREATQEDWDNL